jgi:DNA-directed RNA polymerase, delta subunit
MKKQDNESLIQEIQKRLDWYTMEASDEEFDADEVRNLLKLLDSLTPEEEKDRLSSDEVVDNFWKYCAEREEEERILAEADEPEKKKEHKVLHYFQKHRAVVVAAAVLIVIMLGGSWQMAVNAEKHGGFFWWMDKNEEGTTMITSPETHVRDSIKKVKENYYSIENVPQIYKKYVDIPYEIMQLYEEQYTMSRIQIVKADESDTIYEFFNKGQDEILHFEIKIYPRKILRVRETYPGYVFCEEFENDGINLEVFSKQEDNGNQSYIIYFYYGNEKYAVVGINDKDFLKEIAIKYQEAVVDNY